MIQLHKGDCLEVMQGIETGSVDAIITDPPYGTTQCKWDSVIPFQPMWQQLNRVIKPNGAIVLFGSEPFSSALRMSNIKNYKYDWVWNKVLHGNPFVAKYRPLKVSEEILVFSNGKHNYYPIMTEKQKKSLRPISKGLNKNKNVKTNHETAFGNKKNGFAKDYDDNKAYPKNIISITNASRNKQHPTQKPVALMEYLIKTYTNEGEVVLDFTMGSGSTGVACVNTKRSFIGIEQDDNYFTIAQERIDNAQRQSLIDFPTQ